MMRGIIKQLMLINLRVKEQKVKENIQIVN